jgi:hypothetical protein
MLLRMKSILPLAILALAGLQASAQAPPARVKGAVKVAAGVRAGLPAGQNTLYPANRAPLKELPLVKLPAGAIEPGGWLGVQLKRMADGFTGRLPELSQYCRREGNAWLDPRGEGRFGWEELPYWLKGYINLGYVLRDARIIEESRQWVEAVLRSQREDGYFGPATNLVGEHTLGRLEALDLWPNMVMMYVLRTHYEATGDRRVLDFLLRYFRWFHAQPLYNLLPASWQKWRGGDNLDHIYWLYSQTGEKWLLEAARVNHERTADWVGGIASWHGVNFGQCFREPGQYYQQTHDIRYLRAAERNYDTMMRLYGNGPGGGFAADENARPGFRGPRQGTETCTWVELMFSHEMLLSITGDAKWAERTEDIAFNSLPASMTADLRGLHYLTAPNQPQLDRQNKAPAIDNSGDMYSYNPYGYRCCQHNAAMGWPCYAERQWMATGGNGLAAVFYSANKVRARVGKGEEVTIRTVTDYPFDGAVRMTVQAKSPLRFPLALRIPSWARQPRVQVNGQPLVIPAGAAWLTIEREWANGDTIELTLPAEIEVRRWPHQKNAASVHYGPLAFSLRIAERYQQYGGEGQWRLLVVFPATPWNFALDLSAPLELRRAENMPEQPFFWSAAPVYIRARGRRIPEWRLEPNGLPGEIQPSPVKTDRPAEQIELIPMGAARLRISMFPVAGGETQWEPDTPIVLASRSTHEDPPDREGFRFGGARGSKEWIEYRYPWPKKLQRATPEWGEGGEPQSWRVLVESGGAWKEWDGREAETQAVRLEADLAPRRGAELKRWRVE